jgi:hypothetical protein
MVPSEIIKRLGGTVALSGAALGLGALYGWWQAYATLLDGGFWLGLLLMLAGTLMGGWRSPEPKSEAAEIARVGLWIAETHERISQAIRCAPAVAIGNDNTIRPVVPLSPRKRKPR